MEDWRDVVGFEGKYQVSNTGRVKSFARGNARVLKPGLTSVGYPSVVLGRGNTNLVHSLVAEAFIGPRPAGHEVLHGDGTRDNNVLSNLRYGTRAENLADSKAHGTGHRRMLWRMKPLAVKCAKTLHRWGCTQKEVGEIFGQSRYVISRAVRGAYDPIS